MVVIMDWMIEPKSLQVIGQICKKITLYGRKSQK
jgi:hypothetical protein